MIRSRRRALFCALVLTCTLDACAASGPTVELKGHRFDVEIVADDASRARGLMFRDSMPADHGMLFLFDDLQPRVFWTLAEFPLTSSGKPDRREIERQYVDRHPRPAAAS